jgi:DNA-binding FadR family transcriptional regulator
MAIFDGELKPGESLPSEQELCKIFGVGRQAVREALRTLSVMGLIEITSGAKGSVVKEVGITQYMEAVREQLSLLYRAMENHAEKEKFDARILVGGDRERTLSGG